MKNRIHIFGASGSGTTTLGAYLARKMDIPFFDTDDFYWEERETYSKSRPVPERLRLMEESLGAEPSWILSGSLIGWGDAWIPRFDLAVFLYLPPEIRLERLQLREEQRYGDRILPGGERYEHNQEFLSWAATYDSWDAVQGRTLRRHREWISQLPIPVLELVGPLELEEAAQKILAY